MIRSHTLPILWYHYFEGKYKIEDLCISICANRLYSWKYRSDVRLGNCVFPINCIAKPWHEQQLISKCSPAPSSHTHTLFLNTQSHNPNARLSYKFCFDCRKSYHIRALIKWITVSNISLQTNSCLRVHLSHCGMIPKVLRHNWITQPRHIMHTYVWIKYFWFCVNCSVKSRRTIHIS